MAEEQACLVRARSDSENSSKLGSFGSINRPMAYTEDRLAMSEGSGEPGGGAGMAASPPEHDGGADSGELLDYNDASVLEQFHEDALRQAGCGLAQARVILATSLAVAGGTLELSAIPFVLPSAEIELCIRPHEKNWLVLISLVGGSLGAMGWAPLGERLGRRRTLVSCLAVNAVFAAIAAVMPTYGTFMMARFCSAIGSGGIVGTSYTYSGECVRRALRPATHAMLLAASAVGALAAAALAAAVLPPTPAAALQDHRDHFSAWHRYLLFCTLPILASLVSLIWTPESPRYLLDAGREVDAMVVYQGMHSSNQIRVCGKGNVTAPGTDSEYRLGELSLPGKRRPPALHHVRHSVKMFWQAFFQLFSNTYRNTTLCLGGILLFAMAIQFYLSSYVPTSVGRLQAAVLAASRVTERDAAVAHATYTRAMDNVRYLNVSFTNCTFKDLLMSHVQFLNCSFEEVAFENIKTSYTTFEGCHFYNSTIIDTDLEVGREIDLRSTLNGTIFRGIGGDCARPDLSLRQAGRLAAQLHCALGMLLAAALAAPLPLLPAAPPPLPPHALLVFLCSACVLASPAIYVVQTETALYAAEAVYRVLVTLVFYLVSTRVVASYPANLRCTAHGVFLCLAYAGGACVRGWAAGGALPSAALCAALGLCAAALALRLR